MVQTVLITGSSGLVGTALASALATIGINVVGIDLRAHGAAHGDVRDTARVRDLIARVDGVVHLAAVSRVVWGERDPELCWATNVGGLQGVLDAVAESPRAPWLVLASSREVYGQQASLPVTEDAPLRPVNVYARSKVAGERLVDEARHRGVRACTVRLSNVFGTVDDHVDRVVPAFARAAATGGELRVDGLEHVFDFTHVDDVTRGLVALIALLRGGEPPPPPIHFVTGRPTTLGELARLAIELGQTGATLREAPPRDFDVARFCGDPSRAKRLLGWEPRVPLEAGLARLIDAFRQVRGAAEEQGVAR